MGEAGLNDPPGFARVVIEKPFGHDLQTSKDLAETVHRSFEERQIYRIDHYLGKETVQNIFVFRFANAIFEPVWTNRYVDHVQITVAESLGVEHRAAFYEETGVVRDIVQNHLLQVLALVAMEPPAAFEADAVRDEKMKVLRATRPLSFENTVRGQYGRGFVAGEEVVAYSEEEGVPPDSNTPTFIAAKLEIDNWRWAGMPFYIRTGKRLPKRVTEVAVQFKRVPHLPFSMGAAEHLEANSLVLRIQPDEGISLRFGAKAPSPTVAISTVNMDFLYGSAFLHDVPEAYETPDPRRDPGRPHPLHAAGRGRALVGALRSPARAVAVGDAAGVRVGVVGPRARVRADHARRAALAAAVIAHPPVEVTDLSQVEHALAASREGGVGAVRATTLNLVVYAPTPEDVAYTQRALERIGGSRPLRAIVAGAGTDGVRASVSTSCWLGGGMQQVCSEQIFLTARRDALPSAVLSLLVTDLPTFVWWQGPIPPGLEVLTDLARLATSTVGRLEHLVARRGGRRGPARAERDRPGVAPARALAWCDRVAV